MPTKAELLVFAEDYGITADDSMLKADIESAISAAGFDPVTLEPLLPQEAQPTMTDVEPASQGVDPTLSRQAHFSTYTEAPALDADDPANNPEPGPRVEQTLGVGTEGPVQWPPATIAPGDGGGETGT